MECSGITTADAPLFPFDGDQGILKTCLYIVQCKLRIGSKEIIEIWIVSEVSEDSLNGDSRTGNNGFSDHNLRI